MLEGNTSAPHMFQWTTHQYTCAGEQHSTPHAGIYRAIYVTHWHALVLVAGSEALSYYFIGEVCSFLQALVPNFSPNLSLLDLNV